MEIQVLQICSQLLFISIIVEFSSSIETLDSQQFGAKDYREVGIDLKYIYFKVYILKYTCVNIMAICLMIYIFIRGLEPSVCEVMTNYIRIH